MDARVRSGGIGGEPLVSRARCSVLHAASQNRDRTKHRRSLRPRLCSAPLRKSYALRCVRGTPPYPPSTGGDSDSDNPLFPGAPCTGEASRKSLPGICGKQRKLSVLPKRARQVAKLLSQPAVTVNASPIAIGSGIACHSVSRA